MGANLEDGVGCFPQAGGLEWVDGVDGGGSIENDGRILAHAECMLKLGIELQSKSKTMMRKEEPVVWSK